MAVELRSAPTEGYLREYYLQRNNVMFQAEVRHLVAACQVRPGARLLEIGCGGGGLLRCCAASKKAVMVAGIDMNVTGISLAGRIAPNAALAIADAARLPFASDSFDAVVAQHVIEHFVAFFGSFDRNLQHLYNLLLADILGKLLWSKIPSNLFFFFLDRRQRIKRLICLFHCACSFF